MPERTDVAYGRYHTEDEQFLYIERKNAAGGNGAPNDTSEYWIVRLPDGTTYELGYNTNAEQVFSSSYWSSSVAKYAGNNSPRVAFRWRVDRVTDVHGNVIEFSYDESSGSEACCSTNRDRASYLSEIRYNQLAGGTWGTKISFSRAARTTDISDTVSCPYIRLFYQADFLQKIKVENYDAGAYHILREYQLTYDKRYIADCGSEHCNNTRRLATVTEYGAGGVAGNHALPTTRLSYDVRENKGWDCPGCAEWYREPFRYERLTGVNNGYGGVITVTYATAGDEDADLNWDSFNYHVVTRTVSGGASGGYEIAYTYPEALSDRCYDGRTALTEPNCACDPSDRVGGNLLGFRWVTETLRSLAGTAISQTGHQFQLNTEASPNRALGRDLLLTRRDSSGNDLAKTVTTWITATGTYTGTYFMYPQPVEEFTMTGGGWPANAQKKTEYQYATAGQGGGQYGNVTQVTEYQSGVANRMTRYTYYPKDDPAAGKYIVSQVAQKELLNGAGSAARSKWRYVYDDNADYTGQPTRGDLKKTLQADDLTAGTFITTQNITYTDSAGFFLPVKVADGNSNETTTTYDTTWKMYPLTVTDAKGWATTCVYNYITGTVTSVTGPNTGSTTQYGYNYWGRLSKLARPGDDLTYPTVKYEYYDSETPLRIVRYDLFTAQTTADIPTARFYNGLGQLIQETQGTTNDSEMRVTNTTYNAQGLTEYAYVPYTTTCSAAYVNPDTSKAKTQYAYDALGRVTTVTNPDSTTVSNAYQGVITGTEQAVIDEKSHQKIYQTDAYGRLAQTREYSGTFASVDWGATPYATTGYEYALFDALKTVTDTLQNVTTISYDALQRKTSMTDRDMGTWYYRYDTAGNVISQTDALNQTTVFGYDPLNRLVTRDYGNNGVDINYYYDAIDGGNLGKGLRTSMADLGQDLLAV